MTKVDCNVAIGVAAIVFCSSCGGGHITGANLPHEFEPARASLTLSATPQHLRLGDPVLYAVTADGASGCVVYLYFPSGLDDKIDGRSVKWNIPTDTHASRFSIIRKPIVRGELTASAILVNPVTNTILLQTSVAISIE